MPASGFLFIQSVIIALGIITLFVGGVVRVVGRRPAAIMVPLAVVFAFACPFLLCWHALDYGDADLGWPLVYAHAQSDAGLAGLRVPSLIADFGLGSCLGILYLLVRRYAPRSSA